MALSSSEATPRGFYIALEGINGAGKSTLLHHLEQSIRNDGRTVCSTREPGGTPLGKAIRSLVLSKENEGTSLEIGSLAEVFLFAADRAQHLEQVIRPALVRGEVVLADRSLFSSIAFQGAGRGCDKAIVKAINAMAVAETLPDLVLLLDLPYSVAVERWRARNLTSHHQENDAFEDEARSFHERVREGFLALAEAHSARFVVIDASLPPELVAESAHHALFSLLAR